VLSPHFLSQEGRVQITKQVTIERLW